MRRLPMEEGAFAPALPVICTSSYAPLGPLFYRQCSLSPVVDILLACRRLELGSEKAGLVHNVLPIDQVPPSLGICHLAAVATRSNAPVEEPRVFPGIQAQQGLELDAAGRQVAASLLVAKGLVLEVGLGGAIVADSVHVGGLSAPMGPGIRRAGKVCGQHAVVAGAGSDQPNEAGAEHGRGGDDEFATESLN